VSFVRVAPLNSACHIQRLPSAAATADGCSSTETEAPAAEATGLDPSFALTLPPHSPRRTHARARIAAASQVKGAGEKQIEIDKRLLRDKAAVLRR